MRKLNIHLENCYGIPSLQESIIFDENKQVVVIYASNGSMKTSFAKTFGDIEESRETRDEIFPDRVTVRNVTDESGDSIAANSVVVIQSFSDSYSAKNMATLLVNDKLRAKYEDATKEVDTKLRSFLNNLKKRAGVTGPELIKILIQNFTAGQESELTALTRLSVDIKIFEQEGIEALAYGDIFNSSTEKVLLDPNFLNSLTDYSERYNDLLKSSRFFRRGIFDHNNAGAVHKGLKENGFFAASHSVTMSSTSDDKMQIVTSEAELRKIIDAELETILTDKDLKARFAKIDTQLQRSVQLRTFQALIQSNPEIISRLIHAESFKRSLLKSYIKTLEPEYEELVNTYIEKQRVINGVAAAAEREQTIWANVVREFNDRFKVPFTVEINQREVILDQARPALKFNFSDGRDTDPARVTKDSLLSVLSGGEKRAFYLLNVLFEVEARRQNGKVTLFIVDDIADSFDYRNKYAILQYLREMGQTESFRLVALTHNFDFYRAMCLRFGLHKSSCLIAERSTNSVIIRESKHTESPFSDWRKTLHTSCTINELVASIPFVRTLLEYSGFAEDFNKLTNILHVKQGSDAVIWGDILTIYKNHLNGISTFNCVSETESVRESILMAADRLEEEGKQQFELSEKILLAIATRLNTEKYIIETFSLLDPEVIKRKNIVFEYSINQTRSLCNAYEHHYRFRKDIKRVLDKVQIITPEHLHINSFMYEPLIDLSGESLLDIYREVKGLVVQDI